MTAPVLKFQVAADKPDKQISVFTNRNDQLVLEIDGATIVGRGPGARGPAEAVEVVAPLTLVVEDDITKLKFTGEGVAGDRGWSPVLAGVIDGTRRVLQVVGWSGGEGTEPPSGLYVASTGLVSDIALATDVRGAQGAAGATGSPGSPGTNGTNGANFLSGAGAPGGGTGVNGDTYLNVTTGDLYGPKSGGSWGGVVGSLKGPQGNAGPQGNPGTNGTNGATWRDGTGAPSNGLGADGDYYLNDANGDVYKKTAGAYSVVGNIVGPQGPTGPAGPASLASFTTTDLAEGANLYFTSERVDDRVAALLQNGTGFSWSYNDASNTLTGNVSLAAFTTTNLSEGSNLYYTDERVDDRVAALIQNGAGITWTYNDGANTLTPAVGGLTTSLFAANVVDTDVTLAANSNTRLASQAAVKAYADALIAANDAMVFKGVLDCSANPNYPAADRGHVYKVSVAGKIGGASGPNVEVGDELLCITDGTAAGNHATVGAAWNIIQTNIDGAVVGPTSVTDDLPACFNGTTGKLIKSKTYAAFKTLLALVKGDVGLGNVDNTSDATKDAAATTLTNKTITAAALNGATTATVSNGDSLALRSGGSGNYTYMSLGRTSIECSWGVCAAANHFLTGTAAGDTAFNQATGTWWVGLNGTAHLKVNSSGVSTLSQLNASGNIVITKATAELYINATSSNPAIWFQRNGTASNIMANDGAQMLFSSNAAISAGVTLANGGSSWAAISDKRMEKKSNARPVSVLDKLGPVALIEYGPGFSDIGIVAQDFALAFPQIINRGDDDESKVIKGIGDPGAWSVMYDRVGVIALQGVKELLAELVALRQRVEQLEAKGK